MSDTSSPPSFSPWVGSFNIYQKFAVVLKGGGTYGLLLLGHLEALAREKRNYPIALAGASAGAIVAALIWSGLEPSTLRDRLKQDIGRWSLLTLLLSWQDYVWLWLRWFLLPLYAAHLLFKWFGMHVPCPSWGVKGDHFTRRIDKLLRQGLAVNGLSEAILAQSQLLGPRHTDRLLTFGDVWKATSNVRILNTLKSKTDPSYDDVRNKLGWISDDVDAQVNFNGEGGVDSPSNNLVELIFGRPLNPYFPPLFLSAACIDTGTETMISNLEKKYLHIPIAQAVRVSAGHPHWFNAVKLTIDGASAEYSDGGIISNFPTWTISRQLRTLINQPRDDATDLNLDEYSYLRNIPFITVGSSWAYKGAKKYSLPEVFFGRAQERLEERMNESVRRFLPIKSCPSEDSPKLTQFGKVRRGTIDCLMNQGITDATETKLIYKPLVEIDETKEKDELAALLDGAMFRLRAVAGDDAMYVRLHVYVEELHRTVPRLRKVAMCASDRNGSEFADFELTIQRGGLVGICRGAIMPVVARLDRLQQDRARSPEQEIIGARWADTKKVPNNVNFSIIVPIFDYIGTAYKERTVPPPDQSLERYFTIKKSRIYGPLIGVMSLDGAFNLAALTGGVPDPEPHQLAGSRRVEALISLVERASTEIAHFFHEHIDENLSVYRKKV